jgi:hypothetical protein
LGEKSEIKWHSPEERKKTVEQPLEETKKTVERSLEETKKAH